MIGLDIKVNTKSVCVVVSAHIPIHGDLNFLSLHHLLFHIIIIGLPVFTCPSNKCLSDVTKYIKKSLTVCCCV